MAAIQRGNKGTPKMVNKLPKARAPKVNLKVPKAVTASKVRQPKPELQE